MSQYIFYLFNDPAGLSGFLYNGTSHDSPVAGHVSLRQTQRLLSLHHGKDALPKTFGHETTHGYLHAVLPGIPLWLG